MSSKLEVRSLLELAKEDYQSPNWGEICPRCPCYICQLDRGAKEKKWSSFLSNLVGSDNISKTGIICFMDTEEYYEMEAWLEYRDKNLYKIFFHGVGGYNTLMENKNPYGYTILRLNRVFIDVEEFYTHFLDEQNSYPEGSVLGIRLDEKEFYTWLSKHPDADLLEEALFERYNIVFLK